MIGTCAREAEVLRCAAAAGVPVAEVVVSGDVPNPLERSFTVNRRIPGETIARRILRDDEWEVARGRFVRDCATALARIHAMPVDGLDHGWSRLDRCVPLGLCALYRFLPCPMGVETDAIPCRAAEQTPQRHVE